jgi:hypothetical protein
VRLLGEFVVQHDVVAIEKPIDPTGCLPLGRVWRKPLGGEDRERGTKNPIESMRCDSMPGNLPGK